MKSSLDMKSNFVPIFKQKQFLLWIFMEFVDLNQNLSFLSWMIKKMSKVESIYCKKKLLKMNRGE